MWGWSVESVRLRHGANLSIFFASCSTFFLVFRMRIKDRWTNIVLYPSHLTFQPHTFFFSNVYILYPSLLFYPITYRINELTDYITPYLLTLALRALSLLFFSRSTKYFTCILSSWIPGYLALQSVFYLLPTLPFVVWYFSWVTSFIWWPISSIFFCVIYRLCWGEWTGNPECD